MPLSNIYVSSLFKGQKKGNYHWNFCKLLSIMQMNGGAD